MDNQDYESNEVIPSQTSQGDVTFESKKGDINAQGKTDPTVVDFLLNRNKIIILVAALFVGVLAVFSILLEGTDVTSYVYHKNGKELLAKKVTVHYRKFGEKTETTTQMDLEDYVSKAVYAYSQDIKKIEEKNQNRHDYHLYWALAIALRNEALTNNYNVTYHNDKDIFANYEKDVQIDYALDLAKNLVIVNLNDELISTHVSNYCWSKLYETETEFGPVHVLFHNDLYIPDIFSNEYVTNRVYNECVCNKSSGIIESSEPFNDEDPQCWFYFEEEISTETKNEDGTTDTDTETIYKKEYLHQEEQTGFNLSAAYYYWHDLKYNFLQILTIFYGNDIQIRTLHDKNNIEDETTLASNNGNQSSYCNTSSSTANFETFLKQWEGGNCFCDDAKTIYKTIGDKGGGGCSNRQGTPTIGPGSTHYEFEETEVAQYIKEQGWDSYFIPTSKGYTIDFGTCIPVDVIENINRFSWEHLYLREINKSATKYGVTFTQYQIDALKTLLWHTGYPSADKVVKAYAEGSYEGLWNVIKSLKVSGSGVQKRRKGEFALFVTGDYTDQGKFYDHRDVKDYDNYNSEGVMERQAQCANGGKDGFALPFPSGTKFSCTSPYGTRIHPITGIRHVHSGLDLAAAAGTDILASKGGTVSEVGFNHSSMGNYVRINHEDGTQATYMHMLNNSIVVSKGQSINQGDKIGGVGQTGSATGNHLHFTLKDASGKIVDPYDYLDLSMLSDTSSCHLGGESST